MKEDLTRWSLVLVALLIAVAGCNPATPIAQTPPPQPVLATATTVPVLPTETPRPTETPLPAVDKIIGTYLMPDMPLGKTLNTALPGTVTNDRKLFIGGLSDLWRGPTDPPNQFWTVADRGPTGRVTVRTTNENLRTHVVPEFDPMILRIQLLGDKVEVLETIPIVTASGKPVMGLTNIEGYDEALYDYLGQKKLGLNPNSLDPEGLVRGVAGDFWISEEYSPSLVHLDKTGKVLTRFVPQGLALTGTDYNVVPVLPSVLTKRKSNRGFEGLALSENEKTLYIVAQSPLRNPDKKTGDASRIDRIFAFDIASEKVVAEYAYRLDVSADFDPKNQPAASDMGVCALASVGPTTLVALECTDVMEKLYLIDLSGATNIFGGKWDDMATAPSLESLEDPAKNDVKVVSKSLVLDMSKFPEAPTNIGSVAIIDPNTIAMINDNEYEIAGFDELGNNIPQGSKNKVLVFRLAKPLR